MLCKYSGKPLKCFQQGKELTQFLFLYDHILHWMEMGWREVKTRLLTYQVIALVQERETIAIQW